jgi:hypothetical protein
MKLKELLNIDLDTNPRVTFASYFGSGKSTLLTILSAECYSDGKKILFLTETKAMHILKRFNRCLGTKEFNGKLTVLSVGLNETDLEPYFKKNYDLIVIDYQVKPNQFEKISELSKHYGVAVITSIQLNRFKPQDKLFETNKVSLYSTDIFAVVTRKEPKEKTFFVRLLDRLMFWKKEPNVYIKVVKNRYGKEFTSELHIDFENVKIN